MMKIAPQRVFYDRGRKNSRARTDEKLETNDD